MGVVKHSRRSLRHECPLVRPIYALRKLPNCASLIGALHQLLPSGAMLYVEGSPIAPDVQVFLDQANVQTAIVISSGNAHPRPQARTISITERNMHALAQFARQMPMPVVADHLVAFVDCTVIMEWYDASDSPAFFAGTVPLDKLQEFAESNGAVCSEANGDG